VALRLHGNKATEASNISAVRRIYITGRYSTPGECPQLTKTSSLSKEKWDAAKRKGGEADHYFPIVDVRQDLLRESDDPD
jgi:hypothetical protein